MSLFVGNFHYSINFLQWIMKYLFLFFLFQVRTLNSVLRCHDLNSSRKLAIENGMVLRQVSILRYWEAVLIEWIIFQYSNKLLGTRNIKYFHEPKWTLYSILSKSYKFLIITINNQTCMLVDWEENVRRYSNNNSCEYIAISLQWYYIHYPRGSNSIYFCLHSCLIVDFWVLFLTYV